MTFATPRHFFVVGCPRSGTTLLAVLLDRHSALAVTPETAFFDDVAPQLDGHDGADLAGILAAWRRLPELGLTPHSVLERVNTRRTPGAVLDAILRLYAAANGKARCGEKTPQHLRHSATILDTFADARIVCMLRDGRDVALSLRAMPWGPPTLAEAAHLWHSSLTAADRFAARYPDRFRIVSFEALVADPERTLSGVMTFLGEPFEPRQLQTDVPSSVVLPRSLPWKGQALGSIDPSLPARRRAAAAPEERELLERLLRDALLEHGYSIP
jgi:hypothetical protein